MARRKKSDRSSKLAQLRERLKNVDTGGRAGYFVPKQGRNQIRILPEVGDMEYFFQPVGIHRLPNKKRVYCPKFTSEGELECPICDMVRELYDAGDSGSRTLAKSIRARKTYWMNVISRKEEERGPLVYTPGVRVFEQLITIINDPDYGDIIDPEDGIDVTIERDGSGIETTYTVNARRNSTPIHEDPDTVDKWLDDAKDLTWTEVSDNPEEDQELSEGYAIYVLPYDRLEKELNLDDLEEESSEEPEEEEVEYYEEDEEEEAEDEVEQEVTRRRARRRKTRR